MDTTHTTYTTQKQQQRQEAKLQHKQNDTRKITQKKQHQQKYEADKDTIQLSSEDEQTTVAIVAPATPTTSNSSSNIYALNSGGSNAAYEQRNRSCARSRSRSHSSSSSSLSSTLSSSYRSLDYEAEADEEDANECEGVELQRKLAGGNDNLMHVQNFLNCFDTQERRRQKSTAICCATQPQQREQHEMLRQQAEKVRRVEKHLPVDETNLSHISRMSAENELRARDQIAVTTITTTTTATVAPVAIATAATMSPTITATTTNATAAKAATSKPGKFTISTKFLRKPRHKLKSVTLAPITNMSKSLAATTMDGGEMVTIHEQQKTLQQRGNEHVSQQQQQQQQQHHDRRQPIQVDEPNVNVKFNSNFSINSLLNKR